MSDTAWERTRTPARTLPADWRRIRARVLARDRHRCVDCGAREQLEVDHIGNRDDHSVANLRTLCARCHRRRTAQQAARARWSRPETRARRPPEPHPGLLP